MKPARPKKIRSPKSPVEDWGGNSTPKQIQAEQAPKLEFPKQEPYQYQIHFTENYGLSSKSFKTNDKKEYSKKFRELSQEFAPPELPFWMHEVPKLVECPMGFKKSELVKGIYDGIRENYHVIFSLEDFSAFMLGGMSRFKQLPWPDFINGLGFLFKHLYKNNMFHKNKFWKKVSRNFTDIDCKQFSADSIRNGCTENGMDPDRVNVLKYILRFKCGIIVAE